MDDRTAQAAWRQRAACRGRSELFFAADLESWIERERRESAAHALCAGCPVRDECLDAALSQGEDEHARVGRYSVVWGGTTFGAPSTPARQTRIGLAMRIAAWRAPATSQAAG